MFIAYYQDEILMDYSGSTIRDTIQELVDLVIEVHSIYSPIDWDQFTLFELVAVTS